MSQVGFYFQISKTHTKTIDSITKNTFEFRENRPFKSGIAFLVNFSLKICQQKCSTVMSKIQLSDSVYFPLQGNNFCPLFAFQN